MTGRAQQLVMIRCQPTKSCRMRHAFPRTAGVAIKASVHPIDTPKSLSLPQLVTMRTQTIVAACVAALMLASAAEAHICMWAPRQRGAVDISGPAEDPCYRKVGPCGTNTMSTVTTMTAGQLYTVEFQQNANHCTDACRGVLCGGARATTVCDKTMRV